tara:strand:+ start:230 stop:958 length:729 start_codon:yes stop_codon:yes gene_type:complete
MLMKSSKFNDFEWDYYLLADKLMEVFCDNTIKKESIPVLKSRLVGDLKAMDETMKGSEKMKYRKVWFGMYQLILEIDKPQRLIEENNKLRKENNNLKERVNLTEHYWRDVVKKELKEQFDIDKQGNKWLNQLQTNREITEDIMIKNKDLRTQIDNMREQNKIISNEDYLTMGEENAHIILELNQLKKQASKKVVPESKTVKKQKKQIKRLQREIEQLKDKYENSDSSSSDESSDEEVITEEL